MKGAATWVAVGLGVVAAGVGAWMLWRKGGLRPDISSAQTRDPYVQTSQSAAPPTSANTGGSNVYDLGIALATAGADAYKASQANKKPTAPTQSPPTDSSFMGPPLPPDYQIAPGK